MLNLLSLVIGVFALVLAIPAFIPLLGWANWVIVPIAIASIVPRQTTRPPSRSNTGPLSRP